MIVAMLLIALIGALTWAYQQKKRSEEELSKMIKDMESLTKAEQMLQEMQVVRFVKSISGTHFPVSFSNLGLIFRINFNNSTIMRQ